MTASQSWTQLGTRWSAWRIGAVMALGMLMMIGATVLEPARWAELGTTLFIGGAIFGSFAIGGLYLLIQTRGPFTPAAWYYALADACQEIDEQFKTRHFLPGVLFGCFVLCHTYLWAVSMIELLVGQVT